MCGSRPETAGGRIRAGHLHGPTSVGHLMAGHTPAQASLPGEVVALLGADIVDHSGAGACRVVSGGGLVAKIGPADIVAREAAVLASAADLPLAVPTLVDAGPGWLVTSEVAAEEVPWNDADRHAALADLARLHDAFEERVPGHLADLLRHPFSPGGAELLLEPVRRLGYPLPGRLAALLDDPSLVTEAAAGQPLTLLHGDPWPANVLRTSLGRRVWIDWEMASLGPAAADLATWLDQTPWHTGGSTDGDLEAYLAARAQPVDRARFERALDAARVLWFLSYDVPHRAAGTPPRHRKQGEEFFTAPLAAVRRLAFA